MASDGIWGWQSITDVTNEEKRGDAIRHGAGPGEHHSLIDRVLVSIMSAQQRQSHSTDGVLLTSIINSQVWGYTSKK